MQLTDSREVANNGVSRSAETPGAVAQTELPPESKLLDIDQSAAHDYAEPDSLLKAIEQKTGLSLEEDTKAGESLKEIIQKLGDWAGAEIGGKTIPEDILQQVQDIAKSQGYAGYAFDSTNSRQAHVFDPTQLKASDTQVAQPDATPALTPEPAAPDNPAMAKERDQAYSPEMEKIVHDFHKNHAAGAEYDPANTAKIAAEADELKKQLAEKAETSATAKAALEDLREQDAKDKRLADIAKRIADCGRGGGI